MNHIQQYIALLHETPYKDKNGISVVCYIIDRDRSVVGYNKPIIETSDLHIHAELDAIIKYQQFRFINEFEHVNVYINRVPCSYCLRSLKYCFKNIMIYLVVDEITREFINLCDELDIFYKLVDKAELCVD